MSTALGVASVFLPWIEGPAGTRVGLSQPDGWLTLVIGSIATILAWYQIRAGWIAAGFLFVLLGRNILLLRDSDLAVPGIGLWIGAAAFAVAAALQFIGMANRHRSTLAGNDS